MTLVDASPVTLVRTGRARLRDILTAALADEPEVLVSYAWPGRDMPRECVWIGKSEGTQDLLSFRNGGRTAYNSRPTLQIHVNVQAPGGNTEEADARCGVLCAVIEQAIGADPTLGGLAGLKLATIAGFESDCAPMDDETAEAQTTYTVQLLSVVQ